MGQSQQMEPVTEQELIAFAGHNADYYLTKWRRALKTKGSGYDQVAVAGLILTLPKTGFNWAAFLLSGLWLPFRKMYVPALIFLGILLAESVLGEVLFVGVYNRLDLQTIFIQISGFVAAMLCGTFGNRWYLAHARREIADVRTKGLEEKEHLRMLSTRGGTSLLAALGFFVFFLVTYEILMGVLEQALAQH
jgi:hypothetical protein